MRNPTSSGRIQFEMDLMLVHRDGVDSLGTAVPPIELARRPM
jgi:hypothetical protein